MYVAQGFSPAQWQPERAALRADVKVFYETACQVIRVAHGSVGSVFTHGQ